ncbi:MAG TPA: MauE/DoxX family redox-associated membrane protein [Flavisolibacter sp.]|nr:MauE/DoxX family redox-associated membrane protein [Flavisolibacter sp.]
MRATKKYSLYVMVILYLLAGANHFWRPDGYLKIIPRFLPWHGALNYLAGAFEILFAVMLLFRATRGIASWGLVILLILVFPANIQMAVDYNEQQHPLLWVAYLRLPLQLILIWWVMIYTDWYRSHRVQGNTI